MATGLNRLAEIQAKSWVNAGKINRTAPWSFAAADGNKILGNPPDWNAFGKMHLGKVSGVNAETRQAYSYPFGKNGQVYRSAIIAIRQRAGQQGETDIFEAAGRILDVIDKNQRGDQVPSKVMECTTNGQKGFKAEGARNAVCYIGPGAREKAVAQVNAINIAEGRKSGAAWAKKLPEMMT